MATTTPILGQYEKSLAAATNGTSNRVATDKDTFLKLLVAQLTHQDPLNPVEDKEFIAQLAQFTSVEELQNINKGVEGLNEAYAQQQVMNAASFLGMKVSAKGDMVAVSGIGTDKAMSSEIYAVYPTDVASATFNVYTTNADGSIGRLVYSEPMGPTNAGTQKYQWPGRDSNGRVMPDGKYIVNITALDPDGNNVLVSTNSIGQVVGVETAADGNHMLYLEDGRKVLFKNVELITYVAQNNAADGKTDGKTDDKTGGDTTGGDTTGENTTP